MDSEERIEERICPLISIMTKDKHKCLENECAWWDEIACSVWNISQRINDIDYYVEKKFGKK